MTEPTKAELNQRIFELRLERDRYRNALIEVDMYLAADPDIWRLTAAAKAGDVLCDALGEDVIKSINSDAATAHSGRNPT